mmetsp:Transcript_807/g.3344  ORF Transcript_807/g.3344 Transcript_807/m.3344 type:complete len:423 (+) Transcript_807:1022-2290(+)
MVLRRAFGVGVAVLPETGRGRHHRDLGQRRVRQDDHHPTHHRGRVAEFYNLLRRARVAHVAGGAFERGGGRVRRAHTAGGRAGPARGRQERRHWFIARGAGPLAGRRPAAQPVGREDRVVKRRFFARKRNDVRFSGEIAHTHIFDRVHQTRAAVLRAHAHIASHRPMSPFMKSLFACMISSCVFMTNGPRAAMGSSMGSPASRSTSVLASVAERRSTSPPRCISATPCGFTGFASSPTVIAPRRTNTMVLWPSGTGTSKDTSFAAIRMSRSSTGVCVVAAPFTPYVASSPAMTRMEFSPAFSFSLSASLVGASGTIGMSLARMGWYLGGSILCLAGRFSQSWHISNTPPVCWKSVLWNSSWMIPRAAVIHCTSPGPMTSLFPTESPCSTSPLNAMVMVSNPRCGCCPTPRRSYDGENSFGAA